MLLRQLVDDDLGCASYLIGDQESGEAVAVDPPYHVEPLLAEAESAGVRLIRVLETHTHADHVSGHGRLALEHGIPVCIHAAAEAEYPHDALEDGSELAVGDVTVRTLHTPGHRPEHCCFLVEDALLTGDSLLIGAVARPDLAVEARNGAEGLYESLHRLAELPDDIRVLPGHVAGSLCGAGISPEKSSTIGHERRFNPALALATVEEFVAGSASISTPRPPNMEHIVELNRGHFVGAAGDLRPLDSLDGGFVLDVRSAEEFAEGHVPGAINVPLTGGSFGTRAGFLIPSGATIVLHGSSREEAARGAWRLHAVGYLELAGYLVDPPATETSETIALDELERLLANGQVELLDVREQDERDGGYIPGSRHIPYRLAGAFADDLPRDKPIVTICESGERAAIAASVLAAAGVPARPLLHAGIHDLERRGHHTVVFRRCGS